MLPAFRVRAAVVASPALTRKLAGGDTGLTTDSNQIRVLITRNTEKGSPKRGALLVAALAVRSHARLGIE